MHAIGLTPTDTGRPGGKETGQKVTHCIATGGTFARACKEFLTTGAAILYQDRAIEGEEAKTRKKKAASKTRCTCPDCGLNAWAKPEAPLMCGDCEHKMQAEPPVAPELYLSSSQVAYRFSV